MKKEMPPQCESTVQMVEFGDGGCFMAVVVVVVVVRCGVAAKYKIQREAPSMRGWKWGRRVEARQPLMTALIGLSALVAGGFFGEG